MRLAVPSTSVSKASAELSRLRSGSVPLSSEEGASAGVGALAEAGLSFLGLGVPPPAPSLGSLMASEQSRVMDAPHAVFFPALMLFLTIFALNLVGEQIQKRIDGRAGAA